MRVAAVLAVFLGAVGSTSRGELTVDRAAAAMEEANRHYANARTFEAMRLWRSAVGTGGATAMTAYFNLGTALEGIGQLDLAQSHFQVVAHSNLSGVPLAVRAYTSLGTALASHGDWIRAKRALEAGIRLSPQEPLPLARHNLQVSVNQLAQASALVRRGQMHRDRGEHRDAIVQFNAAIAMSPFNAIAYNNLACVYGSIGQQSRGLDLLEQSVLIDPRYAKAYSNMGGILSELNRLDHAYECAGSALMLRPSSAMHLAHKTWIAARLTKWDQRRGAGALVSAAVLRSVEGRGERDERFPHQMAELLQCLVGSPSLILKAAAIVAKEMARVVPQNKNALTPPTRVKRRHLAVGYVSSDWFEHPAGRSVARMLMLHDTNRIRVTCYSTMHPPSPNDSIYAYVAASHQLVSFVGLSSLEAARRVEEDRVDLLMNLNGYTRGHRSDVFAHNPAPIQMSMVGFEMSMGAPFVPQILGDAKALPISLAPWYSEKFSWLPHTYLPTSHAALDSIPFTEDPPLRSHLVLGSFNRPQKLDPGLMTSWVAATLRCGEMAQLAQAQALYGSLKYLRAELAARGLALTKFIASPVTHPRRKYLDLLRDTDMILDARVFSGATTTLDALWASTPVIAISGENMITRPGISMEASLGGAGVIEVTTLREYEDAIVELVR